METNEKGGIMVGLGIVALIIGIILWLTVFPAIGWILMAIGVILIIAGLLLGAVWGLSRTGGRRGTVY
jgi:signal transduction histidine kinase